MRPAYWVAIAVALLASAWWMLRLDPTVRRVQDRLRERWLLGVPWGTLTSIGLVLVVYLFVQDGLTDIHAPVELPFRSWSYAYPTGWLTASFAHSDLGHLQGNLTSALVLGAIAEYAWGHYPTARGRVSFAAWRSNPYVRAFGVVPGAVVLVGLVTSLFGLGPVIGFSSVVFALAGFALVRYPLTTVVAVLGYRALRQLLETLRNPELVGGIAQPAPSQPWWSEIAIQGHAIGLLIGVVVGVALFRRRDTLATPWRVWTATALFAIAQSLWAVYWYEGTDQYRLYQALGFVLVLVLAGLVATAAASDRSIRNWSISRRQVAVGGLVFGLVLLAAPAVPVNLVTTDPGPAAAQPGIEVGDYRVIYAEDVTNEMVAVVDTDLLDLGEVRTSGVIVASERRDIWYRAASSARLANQGFAWVTLGGVGWRHPVYADRATWSVVGNDSVYQVWLGDADERVHAFASPARTAEPVVNGRTVTLGVDDERFVVTVNREGDPVETVALPEPNASVTAGGIRIENDGGTLYVAHEHTRVPVASRSG